ncbi:MAG: hypothetical protein WDM90_05655 [Ferruginibacter sp.]
MFRLREKDFEQTQHSGGISPEWAIKYKDLEPFYAEAEKLYDVHGKSGIDPTEPFRSSDYAYAPISNEPRIQEVEDALISNGHKPFPYRWALN